jgi:tetratricopeptide (TPR) repeat protein
VLIKFKMKIKMKLFYYLTLATFFSININAQSTQDTLKQFITELQVSPDNNELREKIILVAQRIKPASPTPEEARKKFIMGKTLQAGAKTNDEYALAIDEFKAAVLLAPWYSEFYKDLGLTQELAGQYDLAIINLTLYMLGPLSTEDRRNSQDEIYVIEAKKKKAIKDQQTAIELKAQKEKESISVEGKWEDTNGIMDFQVTRNGETYRIIEGRLFGQYGRWQATKMVIDNQNIRFTVEQPNCPTCICSYDLSLSTSGNELKGTISSQNGTQPAAVFSRK